MLRAVLYLFVLLSCGLIASCQQVEDSDHLAADKTYASEVTLDGEDVFFDSICNQYHWMDNYDQEESVLNLIKPPAGYSRLIDSACTFGNWLRYLPLSKDNSVYLYSGEQKGNQNAQFKVINIDVGTKDLQQCADAVMRLRAEYLYSTSQSNKIHFNYTNGVNISYSKWSSGSYPYLKSNKVVWGASSSNNKTYSSFRKYMDNIFMYAGTASLSKEMIAVEFDKIKIGDVLIKGGFPGHAVIVLDVAINFETKEKCFLLAQSYMPAQNIHILKNPRNNDNSPWYFVKDYVDYIETPEWDFTTTQLKRFKE